MIYKTPHISRTIPDMHLRYVNSEYVVVSLLPICSNFARLAKQHASSISQQHGLANAS